MSTCFIATVSGSFSPDILSSLAELTRSHQAQWQTSKIIKLDSQFTALLKITSKLEHQDRLKQALVDTFPQLIFSYCNSESEAAVSKNSTNIKLVIDCDDRAGLTKDINQILSNLQVNVEHQESYRVAVPSIGDTVYSAQLTLNLPENVSTSDLCQQLEEIGNNIRIAI